jgi:two-component system, NarL family, response regulator LiaR
VIRVLICDDQWIVCQGLEAILGSDPEIEVVGAAENGFQAVEMVEELGPDLVLMDLNMPGMNGVQATQRIKSAHPEVHVLVLTTYGADEWVFDAIRSGADGYLLKGTPRNALIAAVKGTAEGMTHVDPSVAGKLFKQVASSSAPPPAAAIIDALSDRELEVLRLLAQGMNNADIARRLYLSEGTVRNYISAILSKLDVADRTQAAVLALRYGLGQSDS